MTNRIVGGQVYVNCTAIRPRDSGGGGPRSCAVEGALALPLLLPSQNFPHRPRPLHHARFARTVPLPRYRGGGQFSPVPAPRFFARGIVRMALKSLPSRGEQVLHPPKPWRRRDFPLSSSKLLEGLPFEASAKKGSRTPTSPVVRTASFQDAATRCLRSASARRRSTCGSSQRDVGPKGSGPGQASWDVVTRMIRKSGLPVFRPDHPQLNKLLGVIQCLLSQSSGSTPRTGRNAGEHDARTRPRAECMAPRAGAAPAPPWLSTLGRRRP